MARSLLRNLFRSRHVERDLDQEIHSHLELLIDENIRAGMAPKEAQRMAWLELGSIDQVKDRVRERRIGNWLRSVVCDCRYALRQIRSNPGFTSVAVLTLALGVGANTAIFSFSDAILLRPIPVVRPSEVLTVANTTPSNALTDFRIPTTLIFAPIVIHFQIACIPLDDFRRRHCFESAAADAFSDDRE